MKYKYKDLDGNLVSAELVDDRLRSFRWMRKSGVDQWVDHAVSSQHGIGDGYWRKAGRRDAEDVENTLVREGLVEGRGARHARLAKEAIGF